MEQKQGKELIEFWFGQYTAPDQIPKESAWWFEPTATLNDTLKQKFSSCLGSITLVQLETWQPVPEAVLMGCLIWDQLPRNLYGRNSLAYAHDPKALGLALRHVEDPKMDQLLPFHRAFTLMPLMHSEDLEVENRSVVAFEGLLKKVPAAVAPVFEDFVGYAKAHRDVIARFGRFPHRNEALGRLATSPEEAFLKALES